MDRMDKLTTLFESDEQLYFCVGLIILVGAIVIICAMVNDSGSILTHISEPVLG